MRLLTQAHISNIHAHPYSEQFHDVYRSVFGALDEVENVFLKGIHAPKVWQHIPLFSIGEIGFGLGINFLYTAEKFLATTKNTRLFYVGFEGFPPTKQDFLTYTYHNTLTHTLAQYYPPAIEGFFPIYMHPRVILLLIQGKVQDTLPNFMGTCDAWYLDGFSTTPDMWDEPVLDFIQQHSVHGAKVASFSVQGHVRRGLIKRNFQVKKCVHLHGKKETLSAVYTSGNPRLRCVKGVHIVGGGIMGLSLAQWFDNAQIYEAQEVFGGASGSGYALLDPRLLLDNGPRGEFHLSSYMYARSYIAHWPYVRVHKGVLQCPLSMRDARRLQKIIESGYFPKEDVLPVSVDMASQLLGTQVVQSGAYFHGGGALDTVRLKNYFIEGKTIIHRTITQIPNDDLWIVCTGYRLSRWGLPVIPKRGQVSFYTSPHHLHYAISGKGYVLPEYKGTFLIGSTFEISTDSSLMQKDVHLIEEKMKALLPQGLNEATYVRGWANIRGMTQNHMPRMVPIAQNGWAIGALGTRGFQTGPFLAYAFFTLMYDLPCPISKDVLHTLQGDNILN